MDACYKCRGDKDLIVRKGTGIICRVCFRARRNARWKEPAYAANRERILEKKRTLRQENPANAVLVDSRRSDRKVGRHNDLSLAFVEAQLLRSCSYCGASERRMTLDRVNNDVGHTKENCVPSCMRCNYVRRDMPYEAWLVVAKGMKRAREEGLFGSWEGRARRAAAG